jgi:Domain of unknown function (DUF5134)
VTGPPWLAGILAAIMIATAGYCAARLIIARAHRRRDERDVDLVHTVMGVAMAGMLVSWLNPLPDGVWAVMFGAGTGWFGWRAWRARRGHQGRTNVSDGDQSPHRHHVPHLVMCGARVYRRLAAGAVTSAASTGMTMGGPAAAGRFPLLALVLAVFMVGYVMWQADRLPALARASTPRTAPATTPALAVAAAGSGQATQPDEATQAEATPVLPASPALRVLSPRLSAGCQMAMAVTMGYMLILML